MPKKKSSKSTRSAKSAPKYRHFRLHGDYETKEILMYSVGAFIIGIILGIFLQPYIFNALTSYALGY